MDEHDIFEDPVDSDSNWLNWLVLAILWAGIGIALHIILSRVSG